MKTLMLIFSLCLIAACSKDPQERGVTVITDMVYSPAYEAFSANELTPDGKSMMEPVKGSIPRGKMPHLYTNSEDDAIRAGEELQDPYPETAQSLERGKYLFNSYCLPCHGAEGEGDGPITEKGFPGPSRLKSRGIRDYSKGRIYHTITMGFGDMAAHGGQIAREDRWFISQYVKQLQQQ